jgi:hypothetical protein
MTVPRMHEQADHWDCPPSDDPDRGASRSGQEISQIGDDDVGAVSAQLARLSNAIDADHAAETAGAAGLDAGQGIFEHGTLRRCDGKPARTLEKEVRCGLAAKILQLADLRVDDLFEKTLNSGRRDYLPGVAAR